MWEVVHHVRGGAPCGRWCTMWEVVHPGCALSPLVASRACLVPHVALSYVPTSQCLSKSVRPVSVTSRSVSGYERA
jgi:hypothetical protein